jgi:hypothetical protein
MSHSQPYPMSNELYVTMIDGAWIKTQCEKKSLLLKKITYKKNVYINDDQLVI